MTLVRQGACKTVLLSYCSFLERKIKSLLGCLAGFGLVYDIVE